MDATVANPNVDDLNKIKQILLKQADVDASTNKYWIIVLNRWIRFGVDIHTNYKSTVEAITPKDISNYLKNIILKSRNHYEVEMMPQ